MWAAAAVAPASVAPTFSTATPISRSAARASARVSRAPSPSDSRNSATEPTSSSSHSASSSAAASTTAWLPTEATVWKRSPRPSAIALTATFPLCETSATRPAGRGASASPHSAARLWKATSPSQFGPISGSPAPVAASRSSACSAAEPASANPAAKTTSPPQPRRPAARTTSGTPAAGIATTTASAGSGRSSSVGTHGRPSTDVRVGCTPQTGPGNPSASRLRSVASP